VVPLDPLPDTARNNRRRAGDEVFQEPGEFEFRLVNILGETSV